MNRVATLALLAVVACAAPPARSSAEILASMYPLAYAAERVGGDRVTVTDLTPPGAEPHDIELGPDDLEAITSAPLVIYLGGGFQPALEDALSGRRGASLDLLAGGTPTADPHIWLDPRRMVEIVEVLNDALSELEPENSASFTDGARRFIDELRALDERYASGLANCERSAIVVSHAAFGHLASRYDLQEHAIAGRSPTNEPDAKRLAELSTLVRSKGVTTIFTETLVDPSVAETLAAETGVTIDVLDPIEALTREQIDAGDDYLTVMDENLARLKGALGCD